MEHIIHPRLAGGARLSLGGLHLGHLFGNLCPIYDFPEPCEYIFVIKDTEPLCWTSPEAKRSAVLDICGDLLATAFARRITITLASSILREAFNFYCFILDNITFNSIVSTHFKKASLRSGQHSVSVRNFLFPIDEASVLLTLGISHFLSNDDNRRLMHFTRDVAKKVAQRRGLVAMTIPQLHHNKKGGRLLGLDYQRMCKANRNVIRVSEEQDSLLEKCRLATSPHMYYEWIKGKNGIPCQNPSSCIYPLEYLPFYYLSIVCGRELITTDREHYSRLTRNELSRLLFDEMNSIIEPMRQRRKEVLSDKGMILDKVKNDTESIMERVRGWAALFSADR